MRAQKSSKAALFLIELIIAIVFFALASATCVRLFATAHQLSSRSSDLGMAMTLAQNMAEEFKGMQDGTLFFEDDPGGIYTRYYNSQGIEVEDGDALYRLNMAYSLIDDLKKADIVIWKLEPDGEEPVYDISAYKYAP